MPYGRARELVEAAIPLRVEAWAATIELTTADVRFPRFREDVTEALHARMRAHIAKPRRSRWSDIRRDFMRVAKEARAVARHLDNLGAAFDVLPPPPIWPRDPETMFKLLPVQSVSELEELANEADRQAEVCKLSDEGSRPTIVAFATLAAGLARALEHATDAVVSASLVALVDAVLPAARDFGEQATGRRLEEPNSQEARRKYLERMSPDRLRKFAEISGLVDKTSSSKG
jgi:hypothetical protein